MGAKATRIPWATWKTILLRMYERRGLVTLKLRSGA